MADQTDAPSLADMQHWTWVMGRAQQMMLEAGLGAGMPVVPGFNDPATLARVGDFWSDSIKLWQRFLDPAATGDDVPAAAKDRRFKSEAWQNPVFDWIRQSYLLIADQMLKQVDAMEGLDPKQREQFRFATQGSSTR